MAECAAKGLGTPCEGDGAFPTRRCGLCGAVSYCSRSHQLLHWDHHKDECGRFQQQMSRMDELDDFPFAWETRNMAGKCSFLTCEGLHQNGIWKSECCYPSTASFEYSCMNDGWSLPSLLCPCTDPKIPIPRILRCWRDYYEWRHLPFHSPVALLLHSTLTVYHSIQQSCSRFLDVTDTLVIHYLGPDKELLQLALFRELGILFPGVHLQVDFCGPAVPCFRDGKMVKLQSFPKCSEDGCSCKVLNKLETSERLASEVTLKFYKGFYHDRCRDMVPFPHIIVAPNAGIAAYPSWLPTIKLIKGMGVPAVFTDFCEEAANLAADCLKTLTGRPLRIPVQVNPFRQPMQVENNALHLPCYSNCFLLGI